MCCFNSVKGCDEHTEYNATQTAFKGKMHKDRNGPVISRADHLLSASLDRWFGSRGRWHFKTVTNKLYTSEVENRTKSKVSRFFFVLNKTSCEIYIYVSN